MGKSRSRDLKKCYVITGMILVSGLIASLTIYYSAEEEARNPFAEYEDSKRFAHDLERIGGKGALLANEFTNWFSGLWHGQQLGFTISCLTVLIAVVYYFIASGTTQVQQVDEHHIENK